MPTATQHTFNSEKVYKVRPRSVRALKEALLLGPVSVCVNAEQSYQWTYYTKGIIDSESCKPNINHAVIAVGYGQQENKKDPSKPKEYVIIKNSWGPGWGEKGFAKISLSQDRWKGGMCGVMLFNYGVTVKEVIPEPDSHPIIDDDDE